MKSEKHSENLKKLKNMRNMRYVIICVGLLAMLTGCEKGQETETGENSAIIRTTSSALESEEMQDEEDGTDSAKKSGKDSKKNAQKDSQKDSGENSGMETDTQDASGKAKNSGQSETAASETTDGSSAESNADDPENPDSNAENPDADSSSDHQNSDASQNPDVTQDASQSTDTSQDASQNTDFSSEVPDETIPDMSESLLTDPTATESDALTVYYQGHTLTIGGDATEFVHAVKPVEDPLTAPSCYGDGEDVVYNYDDLILTTLRGTEQEIIRNIDIISPGIAPFQGYDIGTAADFKREKKIIHADGSVIIIIEIGGIVEYISYNIS